MTMISPATSLTCCPWHLGPMVADIVQARFAVAAVRGLAGPTAALIARETTGRTGTPCCAAASFSRYLTAAAWREIP